MADKKAAERRSERIGARKIQTMNNTATSELSAPAPIRSTDGLGRVERPELTACVECGENAPEHGTICDECREARMYD